GISIPQDFINRPVDMQLVRDYVQKAETLGYDSLWVQESIVGNVSILEPVSLLNYVAALTTRVRLGTSVMLLVLRNPVQLAKSLSSLDQMSHGRLDVGIGIGGHVPEAIFGLPSEHRIRRFVEAIQVMKALWTEPQASVDGTYWNFKDVTMEPKPVQQPHPPLWFGARQAPALKRAVQHGNGFMGAGSSSTADFIQQYDLLKQFLDEAQRDPATFAISKRVYLAVDTDRDRAEKRLREWFGIRYRNADMASKVCVWGSRDECLNQLGELVHAGAQHLMLNPVFDEMAHLELLAQEVVPKL
ncbi:MAG: LLM class flavin-dependent oxidoreductase, partial [Candidatus Tectomicrobia bacterium]|nr:LLM class flavin-dependent oxidoreductase [Candidatus Tectomicrobia bacterium]